MIKDFNADGSYRWTNINDVLSYGAPFNFVSTVRDTGKTLGAKIRSYKRFIRKGVGTIWVRRIEEDTIRTRQTFINKKFLQLCGITEDDVRIKGNYCEAKVCGTWRRFVEFVTLSHAKAERSADDSFYDTMILDEGFVTQQKRNMYHGDEVQDLLDLYDSKRRDGKMQVVIFGNRESVNNPYLTYFGIPAPDFNFNGIKKYKGGSVIYMQRTTPPPAANDMDDKVRLALAGTKYGAFKYEGVAKDYDAHHIRKKPAGATVYCPFEIGGISVTAWYHDNAIYFTAGRDKNRRVCLFTAGEYKNAFVYSTREKYRFSTLMAAKKNNEVYFADASTAETASEILRLLGI